MRPVILDLVAGFVLGNVVFAGYIVGMVIAWIAFVWLMNDLRRHADEKHRLRREALDLAAGVMADRPK